jgi:hypothetical protein
MARPPERMNKILPLRSSVVEAPPNGSEASCKKGNRHFVNPLGSPREDLEDDVMQVDTQGNTLTIPQDLAERIDAIQEEEVDPESLLLQEMYSRHLRGELNSIEDVRATFETLLGEDEAVSVDFMYESASGSCKALILSA